MAHSVLMFEYPTVSEINEMYNLRCIIDIV